MCFLWKKTTKRQNQLCSLVPCVRSVWQNESFRLPMHGKNEDAQRRSRRYDESREEEFLYCVTTKPAMTETLNSVSEREIYVQMLINKKPVKFHIACGASVNVLPGNYLNKITYNRRNVFCRCGIKLNLSQKESVA